MSNINEFAIDEAQAAKLIQVARMRGRFLTLVEVEEDDAGSDGQVPGKLFAYPWVDGGAEFAVYPQIWSDTAIDGDGELCGGEINEVDANIAFRFTFTDLVDAMADGAGDHVEELAESKAEVDHMIAQLQALRSYIEMEMDAIDP